MIRKLFASGLIITEYGLVIKEHKADDVLYVLVDLEDDTILKISDSLRVVHNKVLSIQNRYAEHRLRVEKLPLSALRAMICYK